MPSYLDELLPSTLHIVPIAIYIVPSCLQPAPPSQRPIPDEPAQIARSTKCHVECIRRNADPSTITPAPAPVLELPLPRPSIHQTTSRHLLMTILRSIPRVALRLPVRSAVYGRSLATAVDGVAPPVSLGLSEEQTGIQGS